MNVIPLNAVPSQIVNVTLNNQACTINIYQYDWGLYVDLYVNGVLIIGGVIALNANLIVRDAYLGFQGDLAFYDTQGLTDPVFTGLGAQYQLVYFAPGEA